MTILPRPVPRSFIAALLACLPLALLLLLAPKSARAATPQRAGHFPTVGPPDPAAPPAFCEGFGLLMSMDNEIPILDTPGSKVVRLPMKTGSVIRLLDQVSYGSQSWTQVTSLERVGQGWVASDLVQRAEKVGPTFTLPRFCQGTHHQPGAVCGNTLPVPDPESEGLWLRTQFIGLRPNDHVQWVLVVNDRERYPAPVVRWNHGCAGETLIALHALKPRSEVGRWAVWFFVNGKLVSMAHFQAR